MDIYGIGTDIVNVKRIKKSLKKKSFIKRIFDKNETSKCLKLNSKEHCFAKRFAAKEAFSKALGIGFSKGISFNEITVQNIRSGKPSIKLKGNTKVIVKKILKKKFSVYLTLSDDKPYAVATVVITS